MEATRKYYKVRYARKSHCDYPSPMFEDYFSARSEEQKERILEKMLHGCEDFDVREISKEAYERATQADPDQCYL